MSNQQDTGGGSAWTTVGILSAMGLVTLFGETMVQPALPDFVRDFGISYETSSWILSSFLISGAVMTPISGKLSDIYGKKRILLGVLVIYLFGVLGAGFSNGIAWMIVARVLMGVGFSAFPVAFGIIRETLPMSKLAIGQTVFGSTFSAGAVVGLVAGAGIIQAFGWRFSFFTVFPVALALLLIIWRFVKEPAAPSWATGPLGSNQVPSRGSLDFPGIALLTITVVTFLIGISLAQEAMSDAAVAVRVAALLATAAASLGLLIVAERRAKSPIVDLELLMGKTILPATVILMVVGTCTFMVYQTMSILVQSPAPLGFGGDKVETATVLLPFMLVLLLGTIGSGFILNRLGNVRMTALGTVFSSIGFFGLLAFHSDAASVTAMLAIISLGLSFAFTGGFNVVLVASPMQKTGSALGMVLLLNLVFQSVGPAVAATFQQLYQGTVPGDPKTYPAPEAYYLIFLVAAFLSVISAALSVWLTRVKLPPPTWDQAGQPPSF